MYGHISKSSYLEEVTSCANLLKKIISKQRIDVDVVAPLMPVNQKFFHLSEFEFDEDGRVTLCSNATAIRQQRYSITI